MALSETAEITLTIRRDELLAVQLAITVFADGWVETEYPTEGLSNLLETAEAEFRRLDAAHLADRPEDRL